MEMAAPTAPEFLEEFGTRAEHFQESAILLGRPGSFAKCLLTLAGPFAVTRCHVCTQALQLQDTPQLHLSTF